MSAAASSALTQEIPLFLGIQATLNTLICFGTLVLSVVIYITAFSTIGWGEADMDTHIWKYGAWQKCVHFPKASLIDECSKMGTNAADYHKAFQGFAVITLLVSFVAVAGVVIYIFVPTFNKDRRVAMGVVGACAVFAFLTFLTAIIFIGGFVNDQDIKNSNPGFQSAKASYSFGLAIGSVLLTTVACALGFHELMTGAIIPA